MSDGVVQICYDERFRDTADPASDVKPAQQRTIPHDCGDMGQPNSSSGQSDPHHRFSRGRSSHRDRAHEAAHGDAITETVEGAPHPLVPQGPAPLLTSNAEVRELIGHLREMKSFAYDSEFIGELTYSPKLCVVQVASRQRVALIDPLAGIDLAPFWELLTDASVEKIVHAGDQDIEPVVRHLGQAPANVFDTQIASGFSALPYPLSLSKLVMEFTGAKLGKGLTFTHWDQRPLSAMQLRYAADDVRYLPRLRHELAARLEQTGHTERAREECEAQCDPLLYRFDPDIACHRVRGAGSLQPRNMAVLRELCIWRDEASRLHDLPPRSFVRDEVLIELSRNPIKSVDKLSRIRGLPRPVELQHGSAIVDATQRALGLPAPQLPRGRDAELQPPDRFRSDALWTIAQTLSAGQQIDPALVASRQDLSDFYRAFIQRDDLSELRIMKGWRRQVLGEPLIQLLQSNVGVDLKWDHNALKASINSLK